MEQQAVRAIPNRLREEFDRFLDAVSAYLWSTEIDADGRWTSHYISPAVEKITGRPPSYYLEDPRRWYAGIHPDDRSRLDTALARVINCRLTANVEEYRVVRPDGAVRWIHDVVTVTWAADGGSLRLDGVLTDITERKQAEEAAHEKQVRLELLNGVLRALAANLAADEVIARTVALVGRTFPNYRAAYCTIDAAGRLSVLSSAEPPGMPRLAGLSADLTVAPDYLAALLRREMLAVADVTRDPRYAPLAAAMEAGRTRAVLDMPLHHSDQLVGLLCCDAPTPHAWTEHETTTLREVADSLTLALKNAATEQERGRTEAALRASEERYRLMIARNLAGVFRTTTQGEILDCNDAFARILGCGTRAEVLGQSINTFYFAPADRLAFLDQLREHRFLTNCELRMRRADGSPVWVLENVSLLDSEGGEPYLEGTIVDITEHKKAEQALRAGEAKYRTLVENLGQSIFLKDHTLRFVAANRRFCQWLGRVEADVVGRDDFAFFPPVLAEKYRADDSRVLAEGLRLELEEESLVDGKPRTVRTVKTPIRDERGNIVGVLGIFWDVTEQRLLEAQLRQAQKMEAVGLLAGGVAHDFNNLLTVILGNMSLLQGRLAPSDSANDLAAAVETAALRAAALTNQLLGFARQTVLRPRSVLLNGIIDEVIHLLSRTIDPRITLSRQAANVWPVRADPGQMHQVLMNLCLNARDAMPDGGTLTLATANVVLGAEDVRLRLGARQGEFVHLSVADTGHGMPPDVQARIFEPFFTTKGPGHGTGLGLAMVFGIVQQHEGWIECVSEVGRGTRFDLYLPRADQVVEAVGGPPADAPARGTETILFVDDEPMLRDLGRMVLTRSGYNVLLAGDGVEAIELFESKQGDIALVVLDLTMPRLSGRDAYQHLAQLDPTVRVLFTSGYSADHLNGDLVAASFLSKPYTPDELVRAVRAVLDRIGARPA